MHLAVSLLNFRPGRIGGAETYLRKLLAHLPHALRPDDRATIILGRDIASEPTIAPSLQHPRLDACIISLSDPALVGARIAEAFTPWKAASIRKRIDALEPDVILFPQQSIFPLNVTQPAVIVVHDLQHLVHPQRYGLFDRAFRPAVYTPSLRKAARIITISKYYRSLLLEHHACDVEPSRVEAVHHGVDPLDPDAVQPSTLADPPYLFYPAMTHPQKQHLRLIDTYAALRAAGRIDDRLVLCGARTPLWKAIARRIDEHGIGQQVIHLGLQPYEEVLRLYRGASAVVFPSSFEGFGLPVIEAAMMHKPTAVADLPVYDELGVPPDHRIDFVDPDQLLRATHELGPLVLDRPPLTWTQAVTRTVQVCRDAAE